jgi:hypothetical protein
MCLRSAERAAQGSGDLLDHWRGPHARFSNTF